MASKNVNLKRIFFNICVVVFVIFTIYEAKASSDVSFSQELYKAPRPTIETVVGPLIGCDLSSLANKLQQCCSEITNLIISTSTVPCNAIPIFGPITIEQSGYYCLNNDIVGQIIIDANNVVLDLNNHIVTTDFNGDAIVVNLGINRIIKNGRITNSEWGIVLDGNTTTEVSNVVISFCGIGSILVINSINLLLQSIISENAPFGCFFNETNNANVLKNILISQSQLGFVFVDLENSVIENCHVLDSEAVDLPLFGPSNCGFGLLEGNNNHFENCSVKRYNALAVAAGFLFNDAHNVVLKNCLAQSITSFNPEGGAMANGFYCTDLADKIQLLQCYCQDVHGATFSAGFNLASQGIIADYCISQSVLSPDNAVNSFGFLSTSSAIALTACQSYGSYNGFNILDSASIQYCQGSYNQNGFIIASQNAIVGNCVANHNDIGFNTVANSRLYRCFAANNSSANYTGGVPNTQNANAQVDTSIVGPSGPFAGGNLFM